MAIEMLRRDCYTMAASKESVEITMYGEIVRERPVDFWTGEEIKGDFIIQSEFLDDLETSLKSGAKKLTLRLNSIGGDAGVSLLIHNRLRELIREGMEITCIVDGVAMSGGSLIMCACDKVQVNPSSLIMIHKAWSTMWGCYNSDDLKNAASSLDAYDKSQASVYARKTGLSETVLMHMMGDTTYMTGTEAVEKGFADELIEGAKELSIAASADGRTIYVDGKAFKTDTPSAWTEALSALNRMSGALPAETEVSTEQEDINTKPEPDAGEEEGGEIPMATNHETTEKTVETAEVKVSDNADAVAEAVENERKRLQEIDEIACLYDEETVREAKYGHPCSAQEMAFRAAQTAAKTGGAFMANVMEDAKAVESIEAVCAPEDTGPKELTQAEVKAEIHTLLHKEGE